jgi:hypothetical protein
MGPDWKRYPYFGLLSYEREVKETKPVAMQVDMGEGYFISFSLRGERTRESYMGKERK